MKLGEIPTNWKTAFFEQPAPYLTDAGFPTPSCERERGVHRGTQHHDGNGLGVALHGGLLGRGVDFGDDTYVIGEDDSCGEEEETLCNGRLKPNTGYVYV